MRGAKIDLQDASEGDAPAGASRWSRRTRRASHALLLVVLVVLAGIFLFPARAHLDRSCEWLKGLRADVAGVAAARRIGTAGRADQDSVKSAFGPRRESVNSY